MYRMGTTGGGRGTTRDRNGVLHVKGTAANRAQPPDDSSARRHVKQQADDVAAQADGDASASIVCSGCGHPMVKEDRRTRRMLRQGTLRTDRCPFCGKEANGSGSDDV